MSGPELTRPPEREADEAPRLYVASLSDYNAGILHGAWIEASGDTEVMQEAIDSMLAASPTTRRYGEVAEEWAIHDYDGWYSVRLGEYVDLATIGKLAEGIRAHGDAFAAWVELVGMDDLDGEAFEDRYRGRWDSLSDYAEGLADDLGLDPERCPAIPPSLRPYVQLDVASLARDMELGGEVATVPAADGGIHVFWTI